MSVVTAPGSWNLTYEGVEADSVEQIIATLAGSGYELVTDGTTADGRIASYQNDTWVATVIWDGAEGGSKALIYGVTSR
ncbi:MAG: hypothetical protein IE935_07525 [Micrococcales bacterium]|nr:hypothetical protein [Micrococcales bacterium]